MELHPIQLKSLRVLELHIRVNSDASDEAEMPGNMVLSIGRSEFDSERSRFATSLKAEIGGGPGDPFVLSVEVQGLFEVDISQFDIKHINHFAETNAPLVLLPYVREHVFGLTSRAGFKAAIMPLMIVPQFQRASGKSS